MHGPRYMAAVCLGLALCGAPALAHHSFRAEFDASNRSTRKGTVRQVDWANPHVSVRLAVQGRDGTSVNWDVEFGPPSMLLSRGVRKGDFRIGAQVTIDGFRGKNNTQAMVARVLTLADGTELFVR